VQFDLADKLAIWPVEFCANTVDPGNFDDISYALHFVSFWHLLHKNFSELERPWGKVGKNGGQKEVERTRQ